MRRLSLFSLLIALAAVVPLGYLALRAAGAQPETWGRLWTGQVPGLVANTLGLLATVLAACIVLGVGCAWLVERTDVPGAKAWRWVLALPLAVPAYVAAAAVLIVFRRGGLLEQGALMLGWERGALPLPDLYSLGGATVIISLVTFPYIFLPAAAALRSINRSWEEAARLAGRGPWRMFTHVTLPLIGPAVGAGGLLVAMYVLSDFGTVALLRYRTFTTAIYNQFAGQVDREGAAILSLLLIGLIIPVIVLERALNRRARRANAGPQQRPPARVALRRWRWPAFGLLGAVTAAALGFPLSVFTYLAVRGVVAPTDVDRIWSVGAEGVWVQALNSLTVAGGAATLAVVLALAPAYLVVRYPSRWTRGLMAVSQTPYVLPGLVAGLGFVLLFNQGLPWLYGTVAALVLGLAFRLLPQGLTTVEAALRSVPAVTEQAGRVLGRSPLSVFRAVTLPLATPGVAAGWALAFITAMKELPMAMLLRPPGYDVLAVRVWSAASESVYTQAAPPALLLVATTLVPLIWVLSRETAHRRGRVSEPAPAAASELPSYV